MKRCRLIHVLSHWTESKRMKNFGKMHWQGFSQDFQIWGVTEWVGGDADQTGTAESGALLRLRARLSRGGRVSLSRPRISGYNPRKMFNSASAISCILMHCWVSIHSVLHSFSSLNYAHFDYVLHCLYANNDTTSEVCFVIDLTQSTKKSTG